MKERISAAQIAAMKGGDKRRVRILRLIMAAIKQREIDERTPSGEVEVLAVLEKMVKQRRDALAQYRQAGRDDLADQEQYELDTLAEFLPEPLSEAELTRWIDAAINETGATDIKAMGHVMRVLKPRVQGRADMGQVSARIKAKLAG